MNYALPDFAGGFHLNRVFCRMVYEDPSLLQDNVAIESVYGCFPHCPLNGGRAFAGERCTRSQMEEVLAPFAGLGIVPRLTFTNMLATEAQLEDPYVRDIFEVGARFGAEVIVYADFVARYAREHFGMKATLSTTREVTNPDDFNRVAELYDCVVLNYNVHKDLSFIDQIEDKSKVEVMVNEYCERNCPRRQAHYLHNSRDQMENSLTPYSCRANKINTFLRHTPGDPVFFTCEEAAQFNRETGIERFKIVGRGIPFDVVLESYLHYLIRPERRRDVCRMVRESLRCG